MSLVYSGVKGALSLNGTKLAKVKSWDLSGSAETVNVAALDEFAPRYRTIKQSYSGRCSLLYYRSANELVQASLLVGVLFSTGRVDPDRTVQLELSADDMHLGFSAVITSVKLGLSVGDVMSADIDFNVNGPLKTVELGGGAFRSVR